MSGKKQLSWSGVVQGKKEIQLQPVISAPLEASKVMDNDKGKQKQESVLGQPGPSTQKAPSSLMFIASEKSQAKGGVSMTWRGDTVKGAEEYVPYQEGGNALDEDTVNPRDAGVVVTSARAGKAKVKTEKEKMAELYPEIAAFNDETFLRLQTLEGEKYVVDPSPGVLRYAQKTNADLVLAWAAVESMDAVNSTPITVVNSALTADDILM